METPKRKTKKKGEINILIASPSDAKQERELLISSLEGKFRRDGNEKLCGHRLIVNAWEDLASQKGHPQDIINNQILKKMDFVVTLFKHKTGSPVIDPNIGNIRSQSGTIEELNLTLDNTHDDHPLGMLYLYADAPQVVLSDPNRKKKEQEWDDLQRFISEIKNQMIYKNYETPEQLLDIICKDIVKLMAEYFV